MRVVVHSRRELGEGEVLGGGVGGKVMLLK